LIEVLNLKRNKIPDMQLALELQSSYSSKGIQEEERQLAGIISEKVLEEEVKIHKTLYSIIIKGIFRAYIRFPHVIMNFLVYF
jgi:hypothetical protein